jgi:poly(3-hydroxybutyrate) depolymerase
MAEESEMAGDFGLSKDAPSPIGPPVFFSQDSLGLSPQQRAMLLSPLPEQPLKAGQTTERTITIDGTTRSYAVHVSKKWDGKSNLPVLYYMNGLHPGSNEPESFTGLSERADRGDFAVVYLRGTCRGNTYNNNQPVWGCPNTDENSYLNAIHKRMGTELPLDSSRQGLVGFSQGGSEAYDLAAKNNWVSSVQSVEGFTTGYELKLDRPISEQSIHAVHDAIVPFGGTPQIEKVVKREADQEFKSLGLSDAVHPLSLFHSVEFQIESHGNYIQPQQSIVDIYNKANGITSKPEITSVGPVTTYSYHSEQYGTDVQEVALGTGTHGWAGSTDHTGDIHFMKIGVPSPDYSASDSVAGFFLSHRLIKK